MGNSIFLEYVSSGNDEEEFLAGPKAIVRHDLLELLRKTPIVGVPDLESSIDLVALTQEQLEKFATDGTQFVTDSECALLLKALKSTMTRMGEKVDIPFRNLTTWRSYWIKKGVTGTGSWEGRRQLLEEVYGPLHSTLESLENKKLRSPLVNQLDLEPDAAWDIVNKEIFELRRKYDITSTTQDLRSLGLQCVNVLEALGKVVHDPALDLKPEESALPYDRPRERICRYVDRVMTGSDNSLVRSMVTKTTELAERVKHRTAPTPQMTGVACDATISLVNMIRRLNIQVDSQSHEELPF